MHLWTVPNYWRSLREKEGERGEGERQKERRRGGGRAGNRKEEKGMEGVEMEREGRTEVGKK